MLQCLYARLLCGIAGEDVPPEDGQEDYGAYGGAGACSSAGSLKLAKRKLKMAVSSSRTTLWRSKAWRLESKACDSSCCTTSFCMQIFRAPLLREAARAHHEISGEALRSVQRATPQPRAARATVFGGVVPQLESLCIHFVGVCRGDPCPSGAVQVAHFSTGVEVGLHLFPPGQPGH